MSDHISLYDQLGEVDLSMKKQIECPCCNQTFTANIDVDGEVEVTVY